MSSFCLVHSMCGTGLIDPGITSWEHQPGAMLDGQKCYRENGETAFIRGSDTRANVFYVR